MNYTKARVIKRDFTWEIGSKYLIIMWYTICS